LNGNENAADACTMIARFSDAILKKSTGKLVKGEPDIDLDAKLDIVVCDSYIILFKDYSVQVCKRQRRISETLFKNAS
jgi:hypothetical protein